MNKKLGIINPNKVPSKVLFGLIEGYINLFPKTFPEIRAKISVNTEISNAVKKKLLPDEFTIGWIKDRLIKIITKIIHTKMLLLAFILNNSNKQYPNMPAKIIVKTESLVKKTKKSTKRPKISPVIVLFIFILFQLQIFFFWIESPRAQYQNLLH